MVEDRLLRRLKRHPDAVGLRAALRERLGFADRERTAEAVVDALRGEQGAIDAGVLRARLRDEFDVEPWLLGFGQVRASTGGSRVGGRRDVPRGLPCGGRPRAEMS